MKLLSTIAVACLLLACEKSQDLGNPHRDGGGGGDGANPDGAPADGSGGHGDAGGAGGADGGRTDGGSGGAGGGGSDASVDAAGGDAASADGAGGVDGNREAAASDAAPDSPRDAGTSTDAPPNGCVIGGAAYAEGAPNPANACEQCRAATSTSTWTPLADGASCGSGQVCSSRACTPGCYISGALVAPGAANAANACQSCQPATSTSAWTAAGDGTACGAGKVCSGATCQAGCYVAGAFVAGGTVDAANACESCQPATSTTVWTPRADGTACATGSVCAGGACGAGCFVDGQVRASGAADPNNACRTCQPATSTTAWTPRGDGSSCGNGQICQLGVCGSGCAIGGTSYASGALDPANRCQSCQPSASTTAFTALSDGTGCGAGQVCSAAACRSGCFVSGAFVAGGALNPTNPCQSCQPATSSTAFTALGDGTSCGAGRVCSAVSCQSGCFIAGGFFASGAFDPANGCQRCQPGVSTTAWTAIDDGTACGLGQVCSAGACQSGCYVAGAFHAGGTINPANACQRCQPAATTTAWTPLGDGTACGAGQVCSAVSCRSGCFIGAFVAANAVDPANACESCQPAVSTGSYTAFLDGTGCGAGQVCSAATCRSGCVVGGAFSAPGALDPTSTCRSCQPATSTIAFTALANGTGCGAGQVCNAATCSAGCFISGAFRAAGAVDPAGPCRSCQPATSTTAFTAVADGTTCGSAQVCSGGACAAGCFIGGGLRAAGALDPTSTCRSCQPATSTSAYTPLADGTSCGAGQVCAAASCAAGCFIGGAFVATGAADPANSCQRCAPASSTTAFTPFSDGTNCGGGKVCKSDACVSPDAGPCTPHAYRCGPSNSVETCNGTGTAWFFAATCSDACSNGVCGATGPCTPGARRCNGGNAEACTADGTTWALDQVCTTYCGGAGHCALDGLQVAGLTNLDGVVYVQGQAHVYSGGTLRSPAGDLTIYADSIIVDQGGLVSAAATGRSPAGIGFPGSIYASFTDPCAGTSQAGGYGTLGSSFSGAVWGSLTDSDVQPGSPGGAVHADLTLMTGQNYFVSGAPGGGVLRLVSGSSIDIAGQMTADGASGNPIACGVTEAAGSGGGILIAGQTVNVSASAVLSTAGGAGSQNPPSFNGSGGLGRIKILGHTRTINGSANGAFTQGLEPPLVVSSASYPDPTLAYNDGGGPLLVAWARPFPSLLGYYVRFDTATGPPPTAADGTFLTVESTTFPATALAVGDNDFHVVPVDSTFIAGTVETIYHVLINATPPSLSSSSHPDQTAWSPNANPAFTWSFPQGDPSVVGAYYLVDHNASTVPDASATFVPTSQKQIILPGLPAGISVFHLVSVDTQGARTKAAAHYRLNIGANPGTGAIVGTVTDGSGVPVGGASVSVNGGLFTQTTNSAGQFNLNTVTPGTWQLTVTSGSRSATRTVTVTMGGVTTANFTLP